jgi:hypothetical protein
VRPVEVAAGADPPGAGAALYYAPDGAGHGLAPGQRVFIELPLAGGGPRKVVPYNAVLYDLKGQAWLYTSPSPRVFVRRPIKVDFVERDLAVLMEGPPAGTEVVTVGAAELYGAESGVGKK